MSLGVVIPAMILTAGFFLFAVTMALRAQRRKTVTGREGLVGETAKVVDRIDPEGKVFLHGEYWAASSAQPISEGQKVRVDRVEGLLLHVVPLEGGPTAREG